MKLHFPETWKIGIFQFVTSGPLEFWRGIHNVRLHLGGKTFLNVMIFFEDAISWDEPVTQNDSKCHLLLGGSPKYGVPCVKTGEKGNILNKVDGGVSKQPKCGWVRGKKMYVTICQPPHPHVHGHNIPNLFHFGDAQQGCTTVWTPSTWCLNTKHVMGWDENANPLSGQSKCLENQLFILFQQFAGYYTTLYYVDGQQVESIGTSPWCIIRDGHGPSALKTH